MSAASKRRRPVRFQWPPVLVMLAALGCDVRDEPVQSADRVARRRFVSDETLQRTGRGMRPTTIAYVEGFAAGVERAEAEGKPLLVICRASWCRWCAGMAQGVLADPAVVDRSNRCICVTLDADRDAETCRRLGVNAFPTVLLLKPDGSELRRLVGRSQVGTLVMLLDEAPSQIAVGSSTTAVR